MKKVPFSSGAVSYTPLYGVHSPLPRPEKKGHFKNNDNVDDLGFSVGHRKSCSHNSFYLAPRHAKAFETSTPHTVCLLGLGRHSHFTVYCRLSLQWSYAVLSILLQEIVTHKPYPQPDLYHRYDFVKDLPVGSIIEDKPIAFLSNTSFPATLSRSK